jgi:uncharacterized protein YcbX
MPDGKFLSSKEFWDKMENDPDYFDEGARLIQTAFHSEKDTFSDTTQRSDVDILRTILGIGEIGLKIFDRIMDMRSAAKLPSGKN